MATIRKRPSRGGHAYNAQVRIQGYPARSKTFTTRRAAERWARKIEGEMAEAKHSRSAEAFRRTLGEAIDKYLTEVVPKKRSPGMPRSTLTWWKNEIGYTKLAEVSPDLVADCRDKLAAGTYTKAKPDSPRSTVKVAKEYPRTAAATNRYLACLSRQIRCGGMSQIMKFEIVEPGRFDGGAKRFVILIPAAPGLVVEYLIVVDVADFGVLPKQSQCFTMHPGAARLGVLGFPEQQAALLQVHVRPSQLPRLAGAASRGERDKRK